MRLYNANIIVLKYNLHNINKIVCIMKGTPFKHRSQKVNVKLYVSNFMKSRAKFPRH